MTTEVPIPTLDDVAVLQMVDKRNMLRLIDELPEQCETAMGICRMMTIAPLSEQLNVVYITGVGTSADAAEFVMGAYASQASVPLVFDRSGVIPAYINAQSLVIVVDYGGKSATAIRAFNDACLLGATVLCVTSGGKLAEAAAANGSGIVRILPGQPPRTACGFLIMPLVCTLEKLGVISGASETAARAILHLKNIREQFRFSRVLERNPAKQMAMALHGKTPIILGATDYRASAARWWAKQISVNGKSLACAEVFPDAAEAEISAWEPTDEKIASVAFVFLKDASDLSQIPQQMEASAELLSDYTVLDVDIRGATPIEKLLFCTYLADYVSIYLALLNSTNPSESDGISHVASRISEWNQEQPTE